MLSERDNQLHHMPDTTRFTSNSLVRKGYSELQVQVEPDRRCKPHSKSLDDMDHSMSFPSQGYTELVVLLSTY